MAEVNFADLANTAVGDVAPPPKMPDGHYMGIVSGPMAEHKAKSGNVAMRFPVKLIEPLDDVDAEELAEAGGVPDKTFNLDFWMSPDARFIFTEFVKGMGVPENLNLIEAAEWLVNENEQFVVRVKSEQDQNNPDRWYTRIEGALSTASYEERNS